MNEIGLVPKKRISTINKHKKQLESDQRLTVIVKTETQYYEEQSELMARFIRILGMVLTSIFSVGAMIGAMITMFGMLLR